MASYWDNEEQAINVILLSVELDKYESLFKNINLDTFLNLTKEDLKIIGLNDEVEQDKFISTIEPFKDQYKHFSYEPSLNIEKTINNSNLMLLYLHADMIQMKRWLVKNDCCKNDPLLEPGVSSSMASRFFINTLDRGLGRMEQYCRNMISTVDDKLNVCSLRKQPWYLDRSLYLASAATATCLAVVATIIKYKKH